MNIYKRKRNKTTLTTLVCNNCALGLTSNFAAPVRLRLWSLKIQKRVLYLESIVINHRPEALGLQTVKRSASYKNRKK